MKAILGLEDGTCFVGESFTGAGQAEGEVIFNTGMTGYQEVLTDPSYRRQLVCMTYPHIGNYGVNAEDVESSRVQVAGFIVKECCRRPSNYRLAASLSDYLMENGVIGLEGIDTRALTRHIRLKGAMRGVISTSETDPARVVEKAQAIPPMQGCNLVDQVSATAPFFWTESGMQEVSFKEGTFQWPFEGPRVVVYDFGVKFNILRLLREQGLQVLVVPAGFSATEVRKCNPDGVFLTNGPGDPAALPEIIHETALLTEMYPIGGICLGHQILALAFGGKSYKLKFGHHGLNHPVKHLDSGRIEISSQNHGFCVDISKADSLKQSYVNLNDATLEGFVHKNKAVMAVQFHPEAAPGPHDSRNFFRDFREMIVRQ